MTTSPSVASSGVAEGIDHPEFKENLMARLSKADKKRKAARDRKRASRARRAADRIDLSDVEGLEGVVGDVKFKEYHLAVEFPVWALIQEIRDQTGETLGQVVTRIVDRSRHIAHPPRWLLTEKTAKDLRVTLPTRVMKALCSDKILSASSALEVAILEHCRVANEDDIGCEDTLGREVESWEVGQLLVYRDEKVCLKYGAYLPEEDEDEVIDDKYIRRHELRQRRGRPAKREHPLVDVDEGVEDWSHLVDAAVRNVGRPRDPVTTSIPWETERAHARMAARRRSYADPVGPTYEDE